MRSHKAMIHKTFNATLKVKHLLKHGHHRQYLILLDWLKLTKYILKLQVQMFDGTNDICEVTQRND